MINVNGGGRGIRTPGTVSRTAVFKTAGINHSPIPPRFCSYFSARRARAPMGGWTGLTEGR